MKRILFPILIVLVAAAAIAAGPQRGPGSGPMAGPQQGAGGPQGPGPDGEILPPRALAEFLGLTETQIEQLAALRETLRTTVQPLIEQQRANHEQIEAALAAGNAAQAGQLLLDNYNLRPQIKAAHDAFAAAFAALLTPEQQAKWDVYQQLMELRRGRGPM